jgi:transcriptional activator HAC1
MSSPKSKNTSTNSVSVSTSASTTQLPPRKRARTEAEKEQRRVERIIRNRKAAHASREKKRKHVEQLESYVKSLELNLSSIYQNQVSLCSKLKSLNNNDLNIVEKINRPEGLLLSDEEESSVNSSDNDKIVKKVKLFKQEDLEDFEEVKSETPIIESKSENDDLLFNLDVELLQRLNNESPIFSSSDTSSPSVSLSDLSNPSTPDNDKNSNGFNLFHNDVMDLNNYLEPEFTLPNEFNNEIDQSSLSIKSIESMNNNGNLMGYFGLYNSVHSAVMHIFYFIYI